MRYLMIPLALASVSDYTISHRRPICLATEKDLTAMENVPLNLQINNRRLNDVTAFGSGLDCWYLALVIE